MYATYQTKSYAPLLKAKAAAELELRERRARAIASIPTDLPAFTALTLIESPQESVPEQPFVLWDYQVKLARKLASHDLIIVLKARQLGVTWLLCAWALMLMVTRRSQHVLVFSQRQLEANAIIDRVRYLYRKHKMAGVFPAIVEDNRSTLRLDNGSSIRSLPATKRAGRSFTANLLILDEFAFMMDKVALLNAAKPTIDNGGQAVVISTADGAGSVFHDFWLKAESGENGYHPVFIPWHAHPARGSGWRDKVMREAITPEDVYREYPATPEEAFTFASGLVWSNFTADNITSEEPDPALPFELAIDDGYIDPRATLFIQRQPGRVLVFDEFYHHKYLEEESIEAILDRCQRAPWAEKRDERNRLPELAVVSHEAVALQQRLRAVNIPARSWLGGTVGAGQSTRAAAIKLTRGLICDGKGVRVLQVHNRCKNLLHEIRQTYRYPENENSEKPLDENDHACEALSGWVWLRMRRAM